MKYLTVTQCFFCLYSVCTLAPEWLVQIQGNHKIVDCTAKFKSLLVHGWAGRYQNFQFFIAVVQYLRAAQRNLFSNVHLLFKCEETLVPLKSGPVKLMKLYSCKTDMPEGRDTAQWFQLWLQLSTLLNGSLCQKAPL